MCRRRRAQERREERVMTSFRVLGDRAPLVRAAENVVDGVGLGLVGSELMRPGDSCFGACAGAGVVVLGITCGFFVFSVAPIVPAFGENGLGQIAIEKGN